MIEDRDIVQLYLAAVEIRRLFGEFNQSWLPEVKEQFWQNEHHVFELRKLVIEHTQSTLAAIERGYR